MPLVLKKVLRSMWQSKMTYLACITVIAVGICCYVALSAVVVRLEVSKEVFYRDFNFADAFARVIRAPESILPELEEAEGVQRAEGRLSVIARVITEDKDKIITLRVYGVDTQIDLKDQLNSFKVYGQPLTEPKDILVGQPFFEAHNLCEGDELELAILGSRQTFTVRGAFNSPEYVFVMPESGSFMPDPYTFEIGMVPKETLENITGQRGVITDIGIKLMDGYRFDDVKSRLNEILDSCGIIYLLPQKEQPSNEMLTMELDGVKGMSSGMSGLFLIVAAAILYIMQKRLVEQERTQIGVLKAFGYSNARVIRSYTLYGLITGLIGGAIGAALGVSGADSMYQMYMEFFRMPTAEISVSSGAMAFFVRGLAAAVSAGMIASLLGVRGALKLRPAEAMRPPAPPIINNSLFENNKFFNAVLTTRGLMTLRYIERNKFKSALIVFSISLAYMLMAIMFSYTYMIDKMMYDQFRKVETYDMKITLNTPVSKSEALSGISAVKGVKYAEAVLEMPFTFRNENLSKMAVIQGLNPYSPVYKIMDSDDVYYTPPKEGLFLTKRIAENLTLSPGNVVTLDSPYLREEKEVRVEGIIDAAFGSGAYMDADNLSMLLDMPPISNAVVITAEAGSGADIKEALINAANVSDISDKEAILQSYHDMMDSYVYMVYVVLLMAIVIAFAIIYNISGVSLSERSRELATMRVLGYEPKAAAEILSFENYILCFFAIIFGIPLTMLAMNGYGSMMDTDLFSMPERIPLTSYIYSGLSCVLAVFMSNIATLVSVKKFELVEVLKERE